MKSWKRSLESLKRLGDNRKRGQYGCRGTRCLPPEASQGWSASACHRRGSGTILTSIFQLHPCCQLPLCFLFLTPEKEMIQLANFSPPDPYWPGLITLGEPTGWQPASRVAILGVRIAGQMEWYPGSQEPIPQGHCKVPRSMSGRKVDNSHRSHRK